MNGRTRRSAVSARGQRGGTRHPPPYPERNLFRAFCTDRVTEPSKGAVQVVSKSLYTALSHHRGVVLLRWYQCGTCPQLYPQQSGGFNGSFTT
jgi:hypothetical protein